MKYEEDEKMIRCCTHTSSYRFYASIVVVWSSYVRDLLEESMRACTVNIIYFEENNAHNITKPQNYLELHTAFTAAVSYIACWNFEFFSFANKLHNCSSPQEHEGYSKRRKYIKVMSRHSKIIFSFNRSKMNGTDSKPKKLARTR